MIPIKLITDVEAEDRLLVYMLAAPDSEIDHMLPSGVENILKFLGLPENSRYEYKIHYPMILAKLRRQWAEAMIKEANGV